MLLRPKLRVPGACLLRVREHGRPALRTGHQVPICFVDKLDALQAARHRVIDRRIEHDFDRAMAIACLRDVRPHPDAGRQTGRLGAAFNRPRDEDRSAARGWGRLSFAFTPIRGGSVSRNAMSLRKASGPSASSSLAGMIDVLSGC
ncbi:MAG: hypothetical protein ACKV19_05680 [Verrucomicrobiales bacterium]